MFENTKVAMEFRKSSESLLRPAFVSNLNMFKRLDAALGSHIRNLGQFACNQQTTGLCLKNKLQRKSFAYRLEVQVPAK